MDRRIHPAPWAWPDRLVSRRRYRRPQQLGALDAPSRSARLCPRGSCRQQMEALRRAHLFPSATGQHFQGRTIGERKRYRYDQIETSLRQEEFRGRSALPGRAALASRNEERPLCTSMTGSRTLRQVPSCESGSVTIPRNGRNSGVILCRTRSRAGSLRPNPPGRAEGTVTLLYSSHDAEHNNAVALKEYIEQNRSSRTTRPAHASVILDTQKRKPA